MTLTPAQNDGPDRFTRIEASHRALPEGATRLGPVAADAPVSVSIYLKPVAEDRLHDMSGEGGDGGDARARLLAHRATHQADGIAAVEAFARDYGLTVDESQAARRLVKLSGPAEAMQRAFRTELHDGEKDGVRFRMRSGSLSLPAALEPLVESVLGLDSRPAAQPRLVMHRKRHAATTSHLPNQLGQLYDFPAPPAGVAGGAGQTIALIELGGGYQDSDNAAAFEAMGLPVPQVASVSVDGGANTPGGDADGEVALDIQVAGGNAPGAAIVVYFAPNTDQGFADAIGQAAHDTAHKPGIISISWGGPESSWTQQAVATMNTQIQDAGTLGVSVFVACGDSLATDGVSDGHAHVDFPASSPYAVGCGGTSIVVSGSQITSETVWNDGTSGTGGGISDLFAVPAFQSGVKLPPSVNSGRVGRGLPDVAGDGAPASGYVIIVGGQKEVVGGTSAVAPLWAGLTALMNQSLGRDLGFLNPGLYANPAGFRQITTGNNKPTGSRIGYVAGPGWNACTGLGRPDGKALLAGLKASRGAIV